MGFMRDGAELLRGMSGDWLGRCVLLIMAAAVIGLPWAIWHDLHDGRRCVEERFAYFIRSGNVTIPVYECVRYVEDANS